MKNNNVINFKPNNKNCRDKFREDAISLIDGLLSQLDFDHSHRVCLGGFINCEKTVKTIKATFNIELQLCTMSDTQVISHNPIGHKSILVLGTDGRTIGMVGDNDALSPLTLNFLLVHLYVDMASAFSIKTFETKAK
jgi:hypothetical protein